MAVTRDDRSAEAKQLDVLEGEGFVYFGPEKWDGLWRNRHQLMTRFARANTVVYVEPRISLRELYAGLISRRVRPAQLFGPLVTVSHDVHVFHSPLWLPETDKPVLSHLLTWLWRRHLKRVLRARGIDAPIIWLSRPEMLVHIGRFDEKLSIYHVVDEYSEYYGMTPEQKRAVKETEMRLLRTAGLSIVVSSNLYKDKSRHAPNVHLVPNAVDFASFSAPAAVPADMRGLPRPIIGYSGLISSRLDLGLLESIAARHPEWTVVLVGQRVDTGCEDEMSKLVRRSNVRFLGRKAVQELPAYIKSFDAGIIPYRTDENADNCSPLKMYEYMAAGRPIVATDFSVAREFSRVVSVASDRNAFEAELSAVLDGNAAARLREAESIAASNTWDDRIHALSALILKELRVA